MADEEDLQPEQGAPAPDALPPEQPPRPKARAAPLEGTSLWGDAVRRLRRNRLSTASVVALTGLFLFCFLGQYVASWLLDLDPHAQDVFLGASGPSWAHPFGTDLLGRDVLTRVMQGGRLSLLVGLSATGVSITIGVVYGAIAGYAGGRLDNLMMRIVDVMYALPYMFLVIILMVFVRAARERFELPLHLEVLLHPTLVLFVALGAVQWLTMARIVRGQVLSLKRREFVDAARTIGVDGWSMLSRHLIPNTLGPVVVYTTLTVPSVILQEAFLSFLGLGVEAPDASWGTLVDAGRRSMAVYPWLLVFPASFLAVTIFCLNALGDGLRDALDPQMRTKR
jgi:oligopeptide transport system permease protein